MSNDKYPRGISGKYGKCPKCGDMYFDVDANGFKLRCAGCHYSRPRNPGE